MVTISVGSRVVSVSLAVVLAARGLGLVAILWASLAIAIVSLLSQAWLAHTVLHHRGTWLATDIRAGLREVSSFGAFTWLKSVLGVLFAHADRLLVAALLGTGPLAFYTLCNQITQPIHALLASGFNYLFPSLSARSASGKWVETRNTYRTAVLISLGVVGAFCGFVTLASHTILRLWLGPVVARQYSGLLIAMTIGNGLLAICIVPHYTALALGRSRVLAFINLVAGSAALASCYLLIPHIGVLAGGLAKILAGVASLSVFAVVRSTFHQAATAQTSSQNFVTVASLDLAG